MMKRQIKAMLENFDAWPEDKQHVVYEVLKWLEDEGGGRELTPAEEAELDEALAEADRKEFLTEEEMKAFFDKFRP
jgi:predicted transcriptional regulator